MESYLLEFAEEARGEEYSLDLKEKEVSGNITRVGDYYDPEWELRRRFKRRTKELDDLIDLLKRNDFGLDMLSVDCNVETQFKIQKRRVYPVITITVPEKISREYMRKSLEKKERDIREIEEFYHSAKKAEFVQEFAKVLLRRLERITKAGNTDYYKDGIKFCYDTRSRFEKEEAINFTRRGLRALSLNERKGLALTLNELLHERFVNHGVDNNNKVEIEFKTTVDDTTIIFDTFEVRTVLKDWF